MLAAAATLEPLARGIHQTTPWLRPECFAPTELVELAAQIEELPICDLPLVKAFDRANSADQFARRGAATQWVCEGAGCGNLHGHSAETTLGEAVVRARAPLSARVAVARQPELRSAPALLSWLARLDDATERPYRDADAYVTRRPHTSASLGWHIDDIDVLLVMLHGRKRFRVAGRRLGSAPVIDHVLEAGDAIYIPALTFHSGGLDEQPEDSTLLSLALPPADADAATAAVNRWKDARLAILDRAPRWCHSWDAAGGAPGVAAIRESCAGSRLALLEPWLIADDEDEDADE